MSLRGLGAQACNTIIRCGPRLLIRSSSVPSYRQPMHVSISFSLSSVPLQPHQPTFFVVLPLPFILEVTIFWGDSLVIHPCNTSVSPYTKQLL